MGLIHSFCMNESNKIYVLNKKKKRQNKKKTPKNQKKKCTGFSKICFYAEECNFCFSYPKIEGDTTFFSNTAG